MIIRQVNKNTFDVFLADEFWGDWLRVRNGYQGVYYVDGKRVNRKVMTDINNAINRVN